MTFNVKAAEVLQTRPAALGITALMILLLMLSGCEESPESIAAKYRSDEQVLSFLKEQYFDVPEKPIALSDFDYTLLDGKKERLSSNRGKLVFLNFWATWCYPCRKEMPDMEALASEMKGEPFRILAVNYGDEPEKVKRFADQYKYRFDIVTDNKKVIATSLSVKGLPTTLIIDTRGRFLGRLIGPADWKKESFIRFFKG